MSLKATILKAVQQIRVAFQDLVVESTLTRRTKKPYVPGTSITYDDVSYPINYVRMKNVNSEEEGERVDDDVVDLYIFPASVIPSPNDVLDLDGHSYRIVSNKPLYAGNDIALSVVRVKPSGSI